VGPVRPPPAGHLLHHLSNLSTFLVTVTRTGDVGPAAISIKSIIGFARGLGELTSGHPTLPSPDGKRFILELDSLLGGCARAGPTTKVFAFNP
jgi:hypothetical protein